VPAHGPRAIHIRPKAELAERVLLPGDPHRALAVAQALTEKPLMFNHARGLWGYTGTARDGEPLTIQSTGMGGPSAAIVVEELIALGARRFVRIGTCGALAPELELADLLVAAEVIPADGASAALGADGALRPDGTLTEALVRAGGRPATVVSTDLFYDARVEKAREWAERGALAVEMEAAAVLRVAALRGAHAACALAVSDVPAEGGMRRLDDHGLVAAGVRIGELGFAALRRDGPPR
jgi:DeoD family purine-nucleoside phosphorylase